MSIGLLAGTKYYSLGYAAVGGVGVISLVAVTRGARATLRVAMAAAVGIFSLSGYLGQHVAWLRKPRGGVVSRLDR